MNAIQLAVAYLVLSFPGQPHSVVVLPMQSRTVCVQEAEAIAADYDRLASGLKLFAHCVGSGLETAKQ
jgi:hypothetical protein